MAAESCDVVRLHITPLDADLIKTVIPAPVLPLARNISFHTIQAFPEKRYGFVDLPQADADRLRKKFHGVTFKGSKMRIEKARPEERIEPTGEAPKPETQKQPKEKKSKKRKREVDVLEGVALRDRKVKRGWTEAPADHASKKKTKTKTRGKDDGEKTKKKRPRSKYTEEEECLLKMKVPPDALKNLPVADLVVRKKKKNTKGSSRQVTVHEFEKTTKFPGFLRQSTADVKRASEFVDGKGWVDEEGNVVEAVKERPAMKVKPSPATDEDDDTSSSGTSSDETSSSEEEEEEEEEEEDKEASIVDVMEEDESATTVSSDENDSPLPRGKQRHDSGAKKPAKDLAIEIPAPTTPSGPKVHPLEALYKRRGPEADKEETRGDKAAEPFSFFGGATEEAQAEEDGETADAVPAMPMTPFTRQDYERRSIRSAAPTPDTAHPARMQRLWPLGTPEADTDDNDDEDDVEEEEAGAEVEQTSTSDFQKWFWKNRRDLNRSWMGRRKMASKEKRHRENKTRTSKV